MARWRPSVGRAALVVSCLALIAAVAGNSIAEVATTALSKKEKKQIRKIASKKVRDLAGELSVSHASTATHASTASHANGAGHAGSADIAASAANADQVDGVSAANPFGSAVEGDPKVVLATIGSVEFKLFCSGGVEQAFLQARTTNGLSAVYHEPGTGPTAVFGGTDTTLASALNQTRTITFTINGDGTPRTIVGGTLTLRHNSTANACQAYGTLLGS